MAQERALPEALEQKMVQISETFLLPGNLFIQNKGDCKTGPGKCYIMISCFDNSVIDLFLVKHFEIVKLCFLDAQVCNGLLQMQSGITRQERQGLATKHASTYHCHHCSHLKED